VRSIAPALDYGLFQQPFSTAILAIKVSQAGKEGGNAKVKHEQL
jgi:hypothetical protein